MPHDDLVGGVEGQGEEGVQEGGAVGTHRGDSFHCTEETNTTSEAIILQ